MRVPSLLEAQSHLQEMNFTLEVVGGEGGKPLRYELRNPAGRVWGRFDSIIAFWGMWMVHASEVLSEGRRAQEFVREYESASTAQRRTMVDWQEGRLSNRDPEPLERWMSQYPDFTPDTLPSDWKEQLKANLTGWIGGRFASRCIIERMAKVDAEARFRFQNLPAKLGMLEIHLVD